MTTDTIHGFSPEFITQVLEGAVALIGSIGITIVMTYFYVKRKISESEVDIIADKAEGNIIIDLEKERNTLKEDLEEERRQCKEEKQKLIDRIQTVEDERNEAQINVSKLTVEVQHLTAKVEELKELTKKLVEKLEKATEELHNYAIQYASLSAKMVKEIDDGK